MNGADIQKKPPLADTDTALQWMVFALFGFSSRHMFFLDNKYISNYIPYIPNFWLHI